MIRDLGQDGAEIELGVEAVQLRRTDEAVHGGGTFATAVGTGEQVVLASESDSPDIPPMSVRNLRFTIVGTRSLGGKFAIEISNSEAVGVSST